MIYADKCNKSWYSGEKKKKTMGNKLHNMHNNAVILFVF